MAKKTITIRLAKGSLSYSPKSPVEVEKGDKIEWKCDNGNFAVLFKGESPCKGQGNGGKRKGAADLHVKKTAKKGDYEYAVMVVGQGGKVYVDDPIIHVL